MTVSRIASLRRTASALALCLTVLSLAACDSAEERAEKHFQNGAALMAAGDIDRALVEFRNVFKLNGQHKEARRLYAEAEVSRGNMREAYAQYLRLAEQYPTDLDANRSLAEIAATSGDLSETERFVTAALAIDPNDPESRAVKIVLDYGQAKEDGDDAGMTAASDAAKALLATLPTNRLLSGVVIDEALLRNDYDAALAGIDAALAATPDDRALFGLRLSTLAAKGDNAGVEAGLISMVRQFPDDPGVADALVRWYVSLKEFDKAEAFLRGNIPAENATPETILTLIRFLAEQKGYDAAIAELNTRIDAGNTDPMLLSTRSSLLFDQGERAGAIADMEAVLAAAAPSENTQKIKVALARMHASEGNQVAARKLVEEVLAEDPGDLDAMKMKAGSLILNDQVGEAIQVLRRAVDDNPRDAELLTLMAQAHERDGNTELMRDMLALAVEAAGGAPNESLRYAQALAATGELLTAEPILIDALRLSPGNVSLLLPLGELYVSIKDWPRAEAVAAELEGMDNPALLDAVTGLRAAILEGQQSTDQAIGYLQGLVDDGTAGLSAKVAIVRAHLADGDNRAALAYAQKIAETAPDDPSLRFILASVQVVNGMNEPAEATFRALLAEDPARTQVWMALYRSVASAGTRADEAEKVLDEALAANPDLGELLWAKAGFLESQGDLDGAIAIYEQLYAKNSANMIIANNLASLITTHRSDDESLTRAELIARRLRGSTVPAYQDTYGWIAYRRGQLNEAEAELAKAAEGLPEDASVQYHYGMALLAQGKKPEAARQFARVIELAPAGDTRPFVEESRKTAESLAAEGVTPGE